MAQGGLIKQLLTTYRSARQTVEGCETALKEFGVPLSEAGEVTTRGRRTRNTNATASGTSNAQTPAGKVSMQQIPEVIRERFGEAGCNYEQIRQMAGWKANAPASNVERLLVKTGKLTLDEHGIYRAPPATPQAQAAA